MPFRQPLRDRCNVFLRVCTDRLPASTKSKLRANLMSSAGNTPLFSPTRPTPLTSSPPPLPVSTPFSLDEYFAETEEGPRQFIPYLYLSSPPSPGALPAGRWTHAIRILPASEGHFAGSTGVTENGSTHILDLYVSPLPSRASGSGLPLSKRHLLVARDFLALALPYYACAHPAEDDDEALYSPDPLGVPPPTQCRTDAVRVLLMGPPRAVLAMATAYIAYASGSTVAHVMCCVVEDAEDPESCAVLGADARMGLGDAELRALESLVKKEM
ncbi:hypothetical protein B0H17DRAFT_1340567 [Mycena rosella]|uniref:Uncharacterized protein n=1 Tax=Mycena rosella TaxID=1033263 RepID=A0AAD7BID2_MYCRO|nr:hypothetical protein B0H17DRAFT_1340567 [Mycena rosella]